MRERETERQREKEREREREREMQQIVAFILGGFATMAHSQMNNPTQCLKFVFYKLPPKSESLIS
jgi:hypothetical protein